MNEIGTLRKEGTRFVFSYPELEISIRGEFAEWVLEAAAEVIALVEKNQKDSQVEELEMLVEFEEASEIDLDVAKSDRNAQFEIVPQCVVSMGTIDFHWVSPAGRDGEENPITRIVDMSLTRNDSFLKNEACGPGAGETPA